MFLLIGLILAIQRLKPYVHIICMIMYNLSVSGTVEGFARYYSGIKSGCLVNIIFKFHCYMLVQQLILLLRFFAAIPINIQSRRYSFCFNLTIHNLPYCFYMSGTIITCIFGALMLAKALGKHS